MTIQDLWDEKIDFGNELPIRTLPKDILKEQSRFLGVRTNGELIGVVGLIDTNSDLTYEFTIFVPKLDSYEEEILQISHDSRLYPLKLKNLITDTEIVCGTEDEFVSALRDALRSTEVIEAINNLFHLARTEGRIEKTPEQLESK